jgi:predicted DNA-binding protein
MSPLLQSAIATDFVRQMDNDIRINVRIPAELRADLEQLAKDDKRTLSDYIRTVLEAHALAELGPRG